MKNDLCCASTEGFTTGMAAGSRDGRAHVAAGASGALGVNRMQRLAINGIDQYE